MSNVSNVKVSRDESRWEAEVRAEISAEALAGYRAQALKEIAKTAKLDGFRPGKAPEDAVLRVYGEAALMRAAAERAIEEELPSILAKEQLPIVEAPRVTTEAPISGKPLSFTARAPLAPKIELPDYKAVAKKHQEIQEDTRVSDDEHAQALLHLRRERHRIDTIEKGTNPQKAAEESKAVEEKDLPAIDDTFVQSLGYENTEKFAEVLRTNIGNEKKLRAAEKKRAAILEDLVKGSTVQYPAILREYELDDIEAQFTENLTRMGRTFDSYLAEIQKTREEARETWKEAADKRTKVRLILTEISRKEGIEPGKAELEHEISHSQQQHPDAKEDAIRAHVAHAMRNEMTLRMLEGNTEPVGHTQH